MAIIYKDDFLFKMVLFVSVWDRHGCGAVVHVERSEDNFVELVVFILCVL